MKKPTKIWKNKLEDYIKELYIEQRKTLQEIALLLKKEKKIDISREAIRKFINKEIPHDNAL
jgi:hypothetical protein